ncbi:hypothetical protein NMG60_11016366 [Bertholletia excelsa]
MEEDGLRVLTISELVQLSRAVTGASSLPRCRSTCSSSERRQYDKLCKPCGPEKPVPPGQSPKLRILKPLTYPTLIMGTLTLPVHDKTSTSERNCRCSQTSCFSFTDGSLTVCCDVLDLDARIIGRRIHVIAWNFIPFKSGGGFLEIISWRLPETTHGVDHFAVNSNAYPLGSGSCTDCEDSSKARYFVHGALESVSPVSIVPFSAEACSSRSDSRDNSIGSRYICGFLAQILICECELCSMINLKMFLQIRMEGQQNHCYCKPLILYFCGPASSWHPVITKLIGYVITLSGLKKKLVLIGKEESQLMYVTTEKTLLHLPNFLSRQLPARKVSIAGKGEYGIYTGTITSIYMQGMVVELDQEVLLLLTDQQLSLPHSLRIGAIVNTMVLLLVSSLRKKFSGILDEKEILGSKHLIWTFARCYQREGMVQIFAASHLTSSVYCSRYGVLREYCKHDSHGCGNEPKYCQLKLVVPISSFLSYCEATWMKMLLSFEIDSDFIYPHDSYCLPSCEELSYKQSMRRVLRSQEMGVILLGQLKISPYSGRLQLIDATGSIDVVIPDLPSAWSTSIIYEVNDFTLVMEGIPGPADRLGLHLNEPFLCRNIFRSTPLVREIKLTIYLLYYFRDAKSRNCLSHSCIKDKGNSDGLQSGKFHLLLVTHKYPMKQKFQGEPVVSSSSSVFAEALILPWDVLIAGTDGHTADLLKEPMEHYACGSQQKTVTNKRDKIDLMPNMCLISGLSGPEYKLYSDTNSCSSSTKSYQEQNSLKLSSSFEIPCHVATSGINNPCLASLGILYRTRASLKAASGCKPSKQKVLLEFTSENFCKYEALRVGGYCMIKHGEEDVLCAIQKANDVSNCKVIISSGSGTHLWSLAFSSYEVLQGTDPSHLLRLVDLFGRTNGVLSQSCDRDELHFLRSNGEFLEFHSDVYIYLSRDAINSLEEDFEVLDEGLVNSFVSQHEVTHISWHNRTMMTKSEQSSGITGLESHLPEGNLVSFHGHVLAVHDCGCSSIAANLGAQSSIAVYWQKFFGVANTVCIHVLRDNHTVKIYGSLSKHAFPVGFGHGVDADFHRVLVLSGQNELILTPTSFIVIKALRVVSGQCNDKCNNPLVAPGKSKVAPLDNLPSPLISGIMKYGDCEPARFHCRVVAIYILVLENNRKAAFPHSRIQSKSSVVNIPLAGFILDDGSSSCCCWASGNWAATLLRLQEGFSYEISESIFGSKKMRVDEGCKAIVHYLDKILLKHGRIIVKNNGSMFDSSGQDLNFSVASDTILSSSDEELLKFVILNACFTTSWTIVGSSIDSSAKAYLEKQLMEMEMAMHPMQNIWARGVCRADPLLEARKLIQELRNQ